MADFTNKMDMALTMYTTGAFPLDAKSYFDSLSSAQEAAAKAVPAGTVGASYYIGQPIYVCENNRVSTYTIQPPNPEIGGSVPTLGLVTDTLEVTTLKAGALTVGNMVGEGSEYVQLPKLKVAGDIIAAEDDTNKSINGDAFIHGNNNTVGAKGYYIAKLELPNATDKTCKIYLAKDNTQVSFADLTNTGYPQKGEATYLTNLENIINPKTGEKNFKVGDALEMVCDKRWWGFTIKTVGNDYLVLNVSDRFCDVITAENTTFAAYKTYRTENGDKLWEDEFSIFKKDDPEWGAVSLKVQGNAFGGSNSSVGHYSSTFGTHNKAYGEYAFVQGRENSGYYNNFIAGSNCIGTKDSCFVQGYLNEANGDISFVAGRENANDGNYGAVLGYGNLNTGLAGFVTGRGNSSEASYGLVAGSYNTIKNSSAVTAVGSGNLLFGNNSFVGGGSSLPYHNGIWLLLDNYDLASNTDMVTAYRDDGTYKQTFNIVHGNYSIGFGQDNGTIGSHLAVFGQKNSVLNGSNSIVAGANHILNGGNTGYSAVFGASNTLSSSRWQDISSYSIVAGKLNNVSGQYSAVFGSSNTVNAGKTNSLVAGDHNTIGASYSMAVGSNNTTKAENQLVIGTYNDTTKDADSLFVVGNGTEAKRENVFVIKPTGAIISASGATFDGTVAATTVTATTVAASNGVSTKTLQADTVSATTVEATTDYTINIKDCATIGSNNLLATKTNGTILVGEALSAGTTYTVDKWGIKSPTPNGNITSKHSAVFGYANTVLGNYNYIFGYGCKATSDDPTKPYSTQYSLTGGYLTKTTKSSTFAWGKGVQATVEGQAVVGTYNAIDNTALFIVGAGQGSANNQSNTPANAFVVRPASADFAGCINVAEGINVSGATTTATLKVNGTAEFSSIKLTGSLTDATGKSFMINFIDTPTETGAIPVWDADQEKFIAKTIAVNPSF